MISRSLMVNGNFFTSTTSTLRVKSVRMSGEPRSDIAERERSRGSEHACVEPSRDGRIVDLRTLRRC